MDIWKVIKMSFTKKKMFPLELITIASPLIQITTVPTVISANIGSEDFEKWFIELCVTIKEGIREVTLGQIEK